MEVILRIEAPRGRHAVVADVDAGTTGAELAAALAEAVGATSATAFVERGAAALDATMTVADLELRHGDLVRFGAAPEIRSAAGATAGDGRPFALIVVAGPAAGRRIPLSVGSHVVGRSSSVDLPIDDSSVSRRHLALHVSADRVEVEDLASTNGTYLDGSRITKQEVFVPGRIVEAGATGLTVEASAPSSVPHCPWGGDGQLRFNRPPRVNRPWAVSKSVIPDPPEPARRARLPLAAALVPLVMGAALAFFISPMFIIFAAMSPVMAVFSFMEERRGGRKHYRESAAAFDTALAQIADQLTDASQVEGDARRADSPSPSHVVDCALRTASDIWERRPTDPDFLALRVGIADLPSRITVQLPERGEAERRERARALAEEHARVPAVPVVVELDEIGVVGLTGDPAAVDGLTRWLVAQATVLHSPRDLAVVVVAPTGRRAHWEWTRWLPHTQMLGSDSVAMRSVAFGSGDAAALLDPLERLVNLRRDEARLSMGSRPAWSPQILVVVDGDGVVAPARLAAMLARCRDVGIAAITTASVRERLPGECRAIVSADAASTTVVFTDSGERVDNVVGDTVDAATASTLALALAPLQDVTAQGATGAIPGRVDLIDLLDLERIDGDAIVRRWSQRRRGLSFPIGVSAAGPLELDLRRDGPHTLAAGATGAGKSEFLQTMVASLASSYPPDRVSFVLVDYKGGLAFKDCIGLPHVAGFVTNLDPHLVDRALTSLNAELVRREKILRDSGAKDLREMEKRDPANAPPNLVIVVDEFAVMKAELPTFVDGIIELARLGRSLGVHLVLATQSPGDINQNIRANAALRIALRVNDDRESVDVLDRPDAARIPASRQGRAFVRIGQADPRELQCAYVGGTAELRRTRDVTVREFGAVAPRYETTTGFARDVLTHLAALVEAIQAGTAQTGARIPSSPWLEPLADVYALESLTAEADQLADDAIGGIVGVIDEPAAQRQRAWGVDLDREGHLLVYGASGSGKTTFVCTLAAALATRLSTDILWCYGLTFGGRGLQAIAPLPVCGDVVAGDEPERVERLVAMLEQWSDQRREMLAEHGFGSMAELRRSRGEAPPAVVVLVDGYSGFHAQFDEIDHGELLDRFARLVADGRPVGIHFVITTDRRGSIPTALAGVIAERVVFRLADADDYGWLGLGVVAGVALVPGRGFVDGNTEFQAAVSGNDPSGSGQAAALRTLAERLGTPRAPRPPRVELLPSEHSRAVLPGADPTRGVAIGLESATLQPAWVDLAQVPHFLVVGPDRSGRTTALATMSAGLLSAPSLGGAYLLSPRRNSATGLNELAGWTEVARGLDACEQLADTLVDVVAQRTREPGASPVLIVIDDGDELLEGRVSIALETIMRKGRDADMYVVAAAQPHVALRAYSGWLSVLRNAKHGLSLRPDVELDGEIFGMRFPRKSARAFPAGRGYLVCRGAVTLVQVSS